MTTPVTVENPNPIPVKEVEVPVKQAEVEHPGLAHLTAEDQEMVVALRKESADKRIAARDAMAELAKIKEDQKLAAEAKLVEDGKLKELLDAKEIELSELKGTKEKVDTYEKYFVDQLEAQMGKLTPIQKELIEKSKMEVSEKLEWAIKLQEDGDAKKESPDSARPGGKAPTEKVNVADYQGPEGRSKLVLLKKTDPILYEAIIKAKNNK